MINRYIDPSIKKKDFNQKYKKYKQRKENVKNLCGSAFGLHPQVATTRNFTNKFGKYKIM